jgi:hypothetical protein
LEIDCKALRPRNLRAILNESETIARTDFHHDS